MDLDIEISDLTSLYTAFPLKWFAWTVTPLTPFCHCLYTFWKHFRKPFLISLSLLLLCFQLTFRLQVVQKAPNSISSNYVIQKSNISITHSYQVSSKRHSRFFLFTSWLVLEPSDIMELAFLEPCDSKSNTFSNLNVEYCECFQLIFLCFQLIFLLTLISSEYSFIIHSAQIVTMLNVFVICQS